MTARVLITGGGGFVGLAVAEALAARNVEVILFDLALPARFADAAFVRDAAKVFGDCRGSDVERALALEPTHILHAAAVTPDEARERGDPGLVASVNLGGTINLVQAAAGRPEPPRIVVLSSAAVYGFVEPAPDGRYDEVATCPAPATLYGISKLAAERAASRLAELHGLDLGVIRLGPVYGPWEHRSGARDLMSPHGQAMDAARGGQPIRLPRPMRSDWLYSRDAGAGIATLLMDAAQVPLANFGGPASTDLEDWCRLLARRTPGLAWSVERPETATILYGLPRDRPALSNARFLAATEFRHRFDLAAACEDYWCWLDAMTGG